MVFVGVAADTLFAPIHPTRCSMMICAAAAEAGEFAMLSGARCEGAPCAPCVPCVALRSWVRVVGERLSFVLGKDALLAAQAGATAACTGSASRVWRVARCCYTYAVLYSARRRSAPDSATRVAIWCLVLG